MINLHTADGRGSSYWSTYDRSAWRNKRKCLLRHPFYFFIMCLSKKSTFTQSLCFYVTKSGLFCTIQGTSIQDYGLSYVNTIISSRLKHLRMSAIRFQIPRVEFTNHHTTGDVAHKLSHSSYSSIHPLCCFLVVTELNYPRKRRRMDTSSSSNNPFSPHKDVLEAPIPDTTDGKQRLMQECKNRATAAVKASVWPDAKALYHKAIDCCCEEDDGGGGDSSGNKAILFANLSFVHGKMHQWDAAADAAQQAIANDPAYTKAWWRKGQAQAALKQFDAAVDAMQEALKLEPQNKALLKELDKLKKQQAEAAADAATAAATSKTKTTTTTNPAVSTTSTKTTTTSNTASSNKPSTRSTDAIKEEEEEETFTKSEHVKGYQVINGKKTTFFHNELSEEAAKLIGDIAPKKLDTAPPPASVTTSTTDGAKTAITSKWNQAGTWEERNVSQWAEQTLTQKFQQTSYTLPSSSPAPNASVTVTSVDLSGHASVATVRGKKRYIYEYSATVHWKFENDVHEATGSMQFPDIDGTCMVGEPYDVASFQVDHADDATLRPVLENFVHKQGFREILHESIDAWVQMFRETY